MARRWISSLHPRDRNGKFRRKAGAAANRAGRSVRRANDRRKSPEAQKRRIDTKITATRVVAGVSIAQNSLLASQATAIAVRSGQARAYSHAATSAALAAVATANNYNDIRFIRATGTKDFKGKSVEEKSKFQSSYVKRSVALNTAQYGLVKANIATASLLQNGRDPAVEFIKNRAQQQNNRRATSTTSGPRAARANRHGVYNISDVKGRRVA